MRRGRIEDGGERPQFIELAAIAFQVVAVQHDCDVGQFVLVPGHAARAGLPQFGKQHVAGAQACLDGGVELSSAQQLAGVVFKAVGSRHES